MNRKWEAWFMGLSFPRARRPVAPSFGIWVVLMCCRGEKAALILHSTLSSRQPAIPFFIHMINWKGWSCASDGPSCYQPCQGLTLHIQKIYIYSLIISNLTGAAFNEQDEFALSLWPSHCQTPHGEPVSILKHIQMRSAVNSAACWFRNPHIWVRL